MSLPEPSKVLSAYAPKPPLERRARRRWVEDQMVLGRRPTEVVEGACARFGVSPPVVRADMKRVRRQWDADEARRGNERRQRTIRRMELASAALWSKGEAAEAAKVDAQIGRLLGMGAPQNQTTVHVDNRSVVIQPGLDAVAGLMRDPAKREVLRAVLREVAAPEALPEPARVVDVKPETNGNGHAGGGSDGRM